MPQPSPLLVFVCLCGAHSLTITLPSRTPLIALPFPFRHCTVYVYFVLFATFVSRYVVPLTVAIFFQLFDVPVLICSRCRTAYYVSQRILHMINK